MEKDDKTLKDNPQTQPEAGDSAQSGYENLESSEGSIETIPDVSKEEELIYSQESTPGAIQDFEPAIPDINRDKIIQTDLTIDPTKSVTIYVHNEKQEIVCEEPQAEVGSVQQLSPENKIDLLKQKLLNILSTIELTDTKKGNAIGLASIDKNETIKQKKLLMENAGGSFEDNKKKVAVQKENAAVLIKTGLPKKKSLLTTAKPTIGEKEDSAVIVVQPPPKPTRRILLPEPFIFGQSDAGQTDVAPFLFGLPNIYNFEPDGVVRVPEMFSLNDDDELKEDSSGESVKSERITDLSSNKKEEIKTEVIERDLGKLLFEDLPKTDVSSRCPDVVSLQQESSKLEKSNLCQEEVQDEKFQTQASIDEPETHVSWVWIPGNKGDLFIPSSCCFQILPDEDTNSDSSSRLAENESNTSSSESVTLVPAESSTNQNLPPKTEGALDESVSSIESTESLHDLAKALEQHVIETKPIPLKQFKNKGWNKLEKTSSFFILSRMIHGFYDLFEVPKYSPKSSKLSTIYEVSESDSSGTISPLRFDAALQLKITQFAHSIIEARINDGLHYDLGSVTTCISENPYSSIDEYFVLGKYRLVLDPGSVESETTLKPDASSELKTEEENEQSMCLETKSEPSSAGELESIDDLLRNQSSEIETDIDLEMFCKQELDKFPKDKLGIRFKQVIKYNNEVLFDCRCNYGLLPLKLRRKYEEQDCLLLEFHHLMIPNQRKIFFSLHCCRHTIQEMRHIINVTGKKKYMFPMFVEPLLVLYRTTYIKSQLTQISAEVSRTSSQQRFHGNIFGENSRDSFVRDWLNNSPVVSERQFVQVPATVGQGIPVHFSDSSQNPDEAFVNLLQLEESIGSSTQRPPTRNKDSIGRRDSRQSDL